MNANAIAPIAPILLPTESKRTLDIKYVSTLNKKYLKSLLRDPNPDNNPFLYAVYKEDYEVFSYLYVNNYISVKSAFILSCCVSSDKFISKIIENSTNLLPYEEAIVSACFNKNISVMEILYAHNPYLLCDHLFKILIRNNCDVAIEWALNKMPNLLNMNALNCTMSDNVARILYNSNLKKTLKLYYSKIKGSQKFLYSLYSLFPKKKII